MADCFWTDFVGCVEDCSAPTPPVAESAYMDCAPSNSDTAIITLYPAADATPFVGDVVVTSMRSWRHDSSDLSGCDWVSYCINANGQLVDTTVPDNGWTTTHTFKPESFFSATGTLYSASGLDLAATYDVGADSYSILFAPLLLAAGYEDSFNHDQSSYGAGTVVLELTDGAGTHYIATGIYHTCY